MEHEQKSLSMHSLLLCLSGSWRWAVCCGGARRTKKGCVLGLLAFLILTETERLFFENFFHWFIGIGIALIGIGILFKFQFQF